tara:strand:+ start:48 stop:281 length:234 start_codon:yes stop_codon:yes gene_type:complete
MKNDKYDILHQRIDIIKDQIDIMMDTITQMGKVIQLLQPITEADLNQGEGGSKGGDDAGPDAEFIDEPVRHATRSLQ